MDDVLENIKIQKAEKLQEIALLNAKLDELRSDITKLEKAEAVLIGESHTKHKLVRKTKPQALTIKQMVKKVLQEYPDGLVALDILDMMNARFNQSYIRTSLSPQLSRLKQSGDIYQDGKVWRIKDKE